MTINERTRRERLWRAIQIRRRWKTTDLEILEGIPLYFIREFQRALMRNGAIAKQGFEYRLLTNDSRLPVKDPERLAGAFRRLCLQKIIELDGEVTSGRVALELDIDQHCVGTELTRLCAMGLMERTGRGIYKANGL